MPAYIVVDIDVTDPVRYEEYKRIAADTVTAHGGRYIVRGGRCETLEGDWTPSRFVVLEFPDYASALACYRSPEYARAIELRKGKANADIIVLDGYDGPQPQDG